MEVSCQAPLSVALAEVLTLLVEEAEPCLTQIPKLSPGSQQLSSDSPEPPVYPGILVTGV